MLHPSSIAVPTWYWAESYLGLWLVQQESCRSGAAPESAKHGNGINRRAAGSSLTLAYKPYHATVNKLANYSTITMAYVHPVLENINLRGVLGNILSKLDPDSVKSASQVNR